MEQKKDKGKIFRESKTVIHFYSIESPTGEDYIKLRMNTMPNLINLIKDSHSDSSFDFVLHDNDNTKINVLTIKH